MAEFNDVRKEIIESLERAEAIWNKVEPLLECYGEGGELRKAVTDSDVISNIPGHKIVNSIRPEVDNFIALVLDIRDSTKHLIQAIGGNAKVSQLQRVFYETTAVNTIGSIIIKEQGGQITEFLGDGFLALFKVSEEDKEKVYKSYRAAKECIITVEHIVNPILSERYSLPPISIGIGMAYSQAIVTVVGDGDNLHPKALGECVFRASKISDGDNEIRIDNRLEKLWPSSKDGKLSFKPFGTRHNFTEYLIYTNEKS